MSFKSVRQVRLVVVFVRADVVSVHIHTQGAVPASLKLFIAVSKRILSDAV